jgi:hypothetical protein
MALGRVDSVVLDTRRVGSSVLDDALRSHAMIMLMQPLLGQVQTDVISGFLLMTLASVLLLYLLPVLARHHVARVGTYAHELSHGVVSLLTGGEFHRFHVHEQGGWCLTSGGNRELVASAGYIGTVLLGAVFLARSAQQESLVIVLQIVAILIALSTLKAGDIRTAAVGTIVAAVLGLSSTLFPGTLLTRFLLNLMGVILVWQGFVALKNLWLITLSGRVSHSDAEQMTQLRGRTPAFWALVYCGIGFVVLLVILRLGLSAPAY